MSTESTPAVQQCEDHSPRAVMSADGFPFVVCACGGRPTSHVWLRDHWPHGEDSGVATLRAKVAEQAAEARA